MGDIVDSGDGLPETKIEHWNAVNVSLLYDLLHKIKVPLAVARLRE